jgi:SulP family sulfate permease
MSSVMRQPLFRGINGQIREYLPFLDWGPKLTRADLKSDLTAAIVGAIVVMPQGLAFAALAGMPPVYGLYTAMVPAIIAALFGSSRHLVSGPTTAASLVVFTALTPFAPPESAAYVQLALTLTFLVGLTQFALGIAKLGMLVNFISHSVVVGFTAGAGILIVVSQLKHFFGLAIPSGHPHETLYYIGMHLADVNVWVLIAGVVTVLAGIVGKKIFPRIPYLLTAMIAGSVAAALLNYGLGAETTGIGMVGAITAALPPLSAPSITLSTIRELAPAVLAVCFLALTEAVSIARSIALKTGQHIQGNQEFIGQGLSNIVGSFFSSYTATGSFNRSAVNYQAGATSPMAAIFAALMLPVLVLAFGPLAAFLPYAVMAGLLALVGWGLVDLHHIKQIVRTSRREGMVMGVTFAATLLLDLEFAILLGVFVAMINYLRKTSQPGIYPRVPDPRDPARKFTTNPALPECPQLKIVRLDGSLFFGAVSYVNEVLRRFRERGPGQKHLLMAMEGVNFLDVAGAEFLAQKAKELRAEGGGLYLYRVKQGAREPMRRGGYLHEIGEEAIFASKTEAIGTIFGKLDRDICATCTRRIFRECQALPLPVASVVSEPACELPRAIAS